ncbi:hypothetical protein TBK1r_33570 [Stieleria magnilauensis]|uniref:Uncharacterized protein n=1 Tax=Stieleria magnilauensis TaxID=2527963 RepID=A0ABX5XQY0_9BACT|nr:hypothetical protein TBK1r_33570 [Planctomycetes bacterium TBK1r]
MAARTHGFSASRHRKDAFFRVSPANAEPAKGNPPALNLIVGVLVHRVGGDTAANPQRRLLKHHGGVG